MVQPGAGDPFRNAAARDFDFGQLRHAEPLRAAAGTGGAGHWKLLT